MTKIAVFVGSLRKDSINMHAAQQIERLLPEGTNFAYADLSQIPLYNTDLEADFPASVQAVKDLVESSDGVLFVTPEHNRGVPAVLKNAIDWTSRPWGSNSFNGKPAAIAGASGPLGTTQAQQQLRNTLLYLNTKLMGQPEMYINAHGGTYDENGDISAESKEFFQTFVDAFVAHVQRG